MFATNHISSDIQASRIGRPMTKPKKASPVPPKLVGNPPEKDVGIATAIDHYQHEKGKRARRTQADDELMAAARREYNALLEAQAAKGKGGRPKKTATPVRSDPEEDPSSDE
jgi:hypothetical protein